MNLQIDTTELLTKLLILALLGLGVRDCLRAETLYVDEEGVETIDLDDTLKSE